MVSDAGERGSLNPPRIFLLGFMGAGKTTAGKLLARQTGWPFFDMDKIIEERENKKIAEIFEEEGEEYFRSRETELLRELSRHKPPVIISCGGGVPVRSRNRKIMERRGIPVYLHVTPESARKRIGSAPNRPLFSGGEKGFEKVKKLWKKRQGVYNKIPHWIESDDPEEKVEKIKEIIRKYSSDLNQ